MECDATSIPIYTSRGKNVRNDFYTELEISYSKELRWKVHLGDVIAIAAGPNNDELTIPKIQAFQPNHYTKASPHWKIGLVTALTQVISPKTQTWQITVQYLHKILDTPFCKDKRIRDSYRPYQKNSKTSQLPHVLIRTSILDKYIRPEQILPIQIQMLAQKEFLKEGVAVVDDDATTNSSSDGIRQRHLQFFCPKALQPDGTLINIDPDAWAQLNAHSIGMLGSSSSPTSAMNTRIPMPLQQAWKLDTALMEEYPEVLPALVQGYRQVTKNKRNERKQLQKLMMQQENERLQQEKAQQQQEQRDSKRPLSGGTSSQSKRVRIQEPNQNRKNRPAPSRPALVVRKEVQPTPPPTTAANLQPTKTTTSSSTKTKKKKETPIQLQQKPKSTNKIKVKPLSKEPLLRYAHKEFYESVQIPLDFHVFTEPPKTMPTFFGISIGQVVAIREEEKEDHQASSPFEVPWSPAQILSIFCQRNYAKKKPKWFVQIRWFFQCHELDSTQQECIRADPHYGMIESMQVENSIEVECVLPAHIQVATSTTTSSLRGKKSKNNSGIVTTTDSNDGLPRIQFSCRHLQTAKAEIVPLQKDWDGYHLYCNEKKMVESTPPLPLERGWTFLTKSLRAKYRELFQISDADSMVSTVSTKKKRKKSKVDNDAFTLSTADSIKEQQQEPESVTTFVIKTLKITPLTNQPPVYQRWGRQFHDAVRLDIDHQSLVKGFLPKTKRWTIKVGYVVPIRMKKSFVPACYRTKKQYWHPFTQPWSAAQIVSIYYKPKTNNNQGDGDEDESSGEWMMQVRWFSRFHELLHRQQEGLESFDKPNVLFETEEYSHISVSSTFPGRLVITSNEQDNWEVERSLFTGLPLIPKLCGHICLDEEIDSSTDWTNYDLDMKRLPAPLIRGLLLDPRNRENKEWILMLGRCYKRVIQERGTDVDEEILEKWRGSKGRRLVTHDSVVFQPEKVQISAGVEVFSSSSPKRDFYRAIRLTLPVDFIAAPSKLEKRCKKHRFGCKVGDVVCFHSKNSVKPPDYIRMKHIKHPWFPYRIPWSFGQILSIHRNDTTGSLNVEIRRLLRRAELPRFVQAFAPTNEDGAREEVFESDVVQEIPASCLLGTASVFLGHHDRAAICNDGSPAGQSRVSIRSKFFYFHQVKRIQQLYSLGFTPESWFRRFQERNLSLSNFCNEFEGLRRELSNELFANGGLDVSELLGSAKKGDEPLGRGILSRTPSSRSFFTEVKVRPNWSRFEDAKLLYPEQDEHQRWKLKLGDFVAVEDHEPSHSSSRYPFVKSWCPAQILAIYLDDNSAEGKMDDDLCFQIRVLQMGESPSDGLPVMEELEPRRLQIIATKDLLGPILACPPGDSFESKWKPEQIYLPRAPCWASKSLFLDLPKVLKNATVYAGDDVPEILAAACVDREPQEMDVDKDDDGSQNKHGSGTAWTKAAPFHIDMSQLRAYYSEMCLLPLRQSYAVGVKDDELRQSRIVKMGDAVLVHCDGAKRYPMDCNWSVGEVVAIWKNFSTLDEMEQDGQVAGPKGNGTQPIDVEVRWLYERHDFQGSYTLTVEPVEDCEEVFESDHVDVIQGGDILCPAVICRDPADLEQDEEFVGIPVHKYLCRRFWSTTRKSLIACGSHEGRQKRGWLYSRHFPVEAQEKFTSMNSPGDVSTKQEKLTWQESMDRIIGKLSLQDASKGAYERGETLIGREKELDQLLSFFRNAIRGTGGTGGSKSSLFLAGPPGVGKTACVRAAIARLRREQAKGDLPTFKFITLNGMEMRHPFEAYGKFWEALTGCKHVGPHELASSKLKDLFTSPKPQNMVDESTVTVLLLDEIDYLITEKQTVLYDFFDWPKQAWELPNARRLVVVGISNTLNLADQLLPSVQSRLGAENKCLFQSYNLKDTIAILKTKLKEASPEIKIFEDDAILLASKKTAGLSGDIRKAFQICRAAAQLVARNWEGNKENQVLQSGYPTVRIGDVQKASLETFNISTTNAISFCSSFQALLLVSVASLRRTTGREGSFDIKDIIMKMEAVAGASGDPQYSPPPSFGETIQLLNSLAERDLIGLRTAKSTLISFRSSRGGSGGAWPLVSPKVDDLLVLKGLKNTPHKSLCEKNLPSIVNEGSRVRCMQDMYQNSTQAISDLKCQLRQFCRLMSTTKS
eukprot:scaffold831_cov109-Cylindrotheca_fusiformis.AAC.5